MTRVVLTIDTATPAVTAGLVRVGAAGEPEVLADKRTVDARAHAECLTPNVLAALAEAGVTMADIGAVVVGTGPGPFTGLRVGMATAAAYGHALDVPVFGVCTLDAIAAGAAPAGADLPADLLVVTDARRREVYWARYRDGRRTGEPAVCAPADVPLDGVAVVAGSAAHAALFGLPVTGPEHPSPAGLAAAVGDWDAPPAALVPLYLRRPDAKTLAERRAGR
ncbi:tRNA (adenosine(37)-N6)-threonylcarbamoyltransferase complex dimerization subunit type 1 TsaB [Mycolicibacterium palauense]|uniref:tRNA (adenosine(37)-N6)-threonylcarbamoyltransferase complex dimerization subunit type 1 TsaB n=1 Tax=Mycolicibacterium palauense TaxID=2034511 RepID=UPI000BFEE064|nr:tRNA (adenosine(37)-N6)-threonylcarbamoyltransferase complex dimerization subunit type 1 TsaB [Mycolicibacterium palauense]